ncbi:IS1/IS1595 family N-terminal zinc-binding domain-containing protein [Brevibacterium renqingii]|uniref:IS1/IS1595 family N-terminal zinc-binding domain-containing protein n=1 Tax=Brevibacterium renqingii TaxID=2776916 RepID=UPI003F51ADA0
MSNPRNHPTCGVCANKLVKNGKTSTGRTRWRCQPCGASTTQARADITRKAVFQAFLNWLLGTARLTEQAQSIAKFSSPHPVVLERHCPGVPHRRDP